MNKIKVFCGFPTNGTVCDVQSFKIRHIQEKYGDKVELVFPAVCVRRMFHDYARNMMVQEFLDSDCDVLWMLDSDVSPPTHVMELVTEHYDKWKVAGAPYPVFMTPPGQTNPQVVFTVYKGTNGKGLAPSEVPDSGTEFVDGLATGCLFIKREVFSQLEQPYFEFKYDPQTRNLIEGEDLGFCLKLKELGIPFFTDYSMVCKHYKNICLLEVNNYAMDYAKRSLVAFEQELRPQLAETVKAAFEAGKRSQQKAAPKSALILPNSNF